MLINDLLALAALILGLRGVCRIHMEGRFAILFALHSLALVLVLQIVPFSSSQPADLIAWNGRQHVLTVALFAFA
ncbi:MAG: hypothetical protein HY651_02080 [Acidobacteria bacterium]|nr:hypothetical protein [Acidobacteriota bacterium]